MKEVSPRQGPPWNLAGVFEILESVLCDLCADLGCFSAVNALKVA
jgi:hypothetical protein